MWGLASFEYLASGTQWAWHGVQSCWETCSNCFRSSPSEEPEAREQLLPKEDEENSPGQNSHASFPFAQAQEFKDPWQYSITFWERLKKNTWDFLKNLPANFTRSVKLIGSFAGSIEYLVDIFSEVAPTLSIWAAFPTVFYWTLCGLMGFAAFETVAGCLKKYPYTNRLVEALETFFYSLVFINAMLYNFTGTTTRFVLSLTLPLFNALIENFSIKYASLHGVPAWRGTPQQTDAPTNWKEAVFKGIIRPLIRIAQLLVPSFIALAVGKRCGDYFADTDSTSKDFLTPGTYAGILLAFLTLLSSTASIRVSWNRSTHHIEQSSVFKFSQFIMALNSFLLGEVQTRQFGVTAYLLAIKKLEEGIEFNTWQSVLIFLAALLGAVPSALGAAQLFKAGCHTIATAEEEQRTQRGSSNVEYVLRENATPESISQIVRQELSQLFSKGAKHRKEEESFLSYVRRYLLDDIVTKEPPRIKKSSYKPHRHGHHGHR